jgi:hypothetical protein
LRFRPFEHLGLALIEPETLYPTAATLPTISYIDAGPATENDAALPLLPTPGLTDG